MIWNKAMESVVIKFNIPFRFFFLSLSLSLSLNHLLFQYLSKQTAALREVNDSRLRIYEQLEVSIQDLEKSNQRLAAEGAADKRKIKR